MDSVSLGKIGPLKFKIIIDIEQEVCNLWVYREWKEVGGGESKWILDEEQAIVDMGFECKYKGKKVKSVYVSNLNVGEDFRRKGLGKLVMSCIKALAVYFDCKVELTAGIGSEGFYRKLRMKESKDGHMKWCPRKKKEK